MTGIVLYLLTAVPLQPAPTEPSPIYGGERTDGYDAVVAVEAGSAFCTGTVVAPRLILTAAHCVVGVPKTSKVEVFWGPQKL